MPRQVIYRSETAGDPQTVLQDDKAPILTLNPDYLDCHSDTDPAGDLGKKYWVPPVNVSMANTRLNQLLEKTLR